MIPGCASERDPTAVDVSSVITIVWVKVPKEALSRPSKLTSDITPASQGGRLWYGLSSQSRCQWHQERQTQSSSTRLAFRAQECDCCNNAVPSYEFGTSLTEMVNDASKNQQHYAGQQLTQAFKLNVFLPPITATLTMIVVPS